MDAPGATRVSGSGGHGIAFGALLEKPGSYRISLDGVASSEASTQVEMRVGRGWAALTAWLAPDAPAGPEGAVAAAGMTPPRATGSSSERAWFRSWAFPGAADRNRAASQMAATVERVLNVPPEGHLRVGLLPAYRGDPRAAITAVFGSLYLLYSVVIDWIVLLLWDVLVPTRAHPPSATPAQFLVPVASVALFAGYVMGVPRLRLTWVVRRRPPTAAEVDGNLPGLTILGLVAPPVLMLLLLAISTRP